VVQKIRNGYPDILIGGFFDNGKYKEDYGPNGIIDYIQPRVLPILPEKFYNIGLLLSYGAANRDLYSRVWRPFFEISPFYSKYSKQYSVSFNGGIGGKVFGQDNLAIGTTYSENVNGIQGKVFEIYLDYQFMYANPLNEK
jgi:hypothetical protein